ncbi:MAG: hypothetical protein A4E53_01958 [Pelotomaculum sp. PtaB.Bin104]|nr:MAG: hypothetical protein A4E53_01958 [Pelotomaculum sp. PtaB.Bin104]
MLSYSEKRLFVPDSNFDLVLQLTAQADIVRMDMEEKLIEAFSTPFARQDIYYIPVIMDRIIEYARTAMQAIKEYEVKPDCFIISMARELSEATFLFARAVALLESDPIHARSKIQAIRKAQAAVDEHYRKGMSDIFKTSDVMRAIKYHEINCHLREAAIYLGSTVDILHRIVVRLA